MGRGGRREVEKGREGKEWDRQGRKKDGEGRVLGLRGISGRIESKGGWRGG